MKIKNVVIFLLLVVITTFVLYCIIPLSLDSVWNYGFSYNITKGLIPYKDFNMVITPLFPYVVALFLSLMGNNFLVYYVLTSTLIVAVTFFAYRKIGTKSLFIYLFLLIYPHNGYNLFEVFLIFILLYLLEKDYKYKDLLIAIIISCMFLSKQTLILCIIPSIMYAKNKKKIIAFYLIIILSYGLYLIINNNLFEFIDYCILGMVDFGNHNTTAFNSLTFVQIVLCIYLMWELVRSKFKDKNVFYILLLQVISFPITDGSHFVLTFSPIIYYLYIKYNDNARFKFLLSILLIFYIMGSFSVLKESLKFDKIYYNNNSVFNYKKMPNYITTYINTVDKYSKKYPKHRLYLLDSRAYIAKLDLGIKINKYDLINDGNMGYKGHIKYVKEIDKYCKKNKCIFIVNNEEVRQEINQTNNYITDYVTKNYYEIYGSIIDSVYIN